MYELFFTFAKMEFRNNIRIIRYPSTQDKSLQAWNSADDLIIDYLKPEDVKQKEMIIYHDRFGYLSCHFHNYEPLIVTNFKSQQKSIINNLDKNNLNYNKNRFITPLDNIGETIKTAIVKIPKSTDLFELYLNQLVHSLNSDSRVVCGFMTRNFSKQALEIANNYFEEVEQTKAWKKARLMILKKPKKRDKAELVHEIELSANQVLKQYYGVFSASKIDIATRFFLENLQTGQSQQPKDILDLGCGNGVLAYKARQLNPSAPIYLTDDNFLAVESAKLNLGSSPVNHFLFTDDLTDFKDKSLDLVLSNPPFHFEYENNIDITLNLFKEVFRILKPAGEFQLVANLHLNYKAHLIKLFTSVSTLAQNNKFIVYKCIK